MNTKGLSRRDILRSTAALAAASMAKPMIRITAATDAPVSIAAVMPLASKLMPLVSKYHNFFLSLDDGYLPTGEIDVGLAWAAQIEAAAENLRASQDLKRILISDPSDTAQLSAFFKNDNNTDKFSECYYQKTPTKETWLDSSIYRSNIEFDAERLNEHAHNLFVIEQKWREKIADFLSFPFKDYDIERFVVSQNSRIEALNYLLQEAPELFPPERLKIFRALMQNAKTADESHIQNQWQFSATDLTYRWGLTDAQNTWLLQSPHISPCR